MSGKLRFLRFIFYVFLLKSTILFSQNDVLRFKRITSQQGLFENKVTAVFQDFEGLLWVGSKIAINRFDGEMTKVYHLGQNNTINQFFQDSNKNIWVATEYGLYFYDKNKDLFLKMKSSSKKVNTLFNSSVFCILETKKDEILVSGQGDALVQLKLDTNGKIIDNSIKMVLNHCG